MLFSLISCAHTEARAPYPPADDARRCWALGLTRCRGVPGAWPCPSVLPCSCQPAGQWLLLGRKALNLPQLQGLGHWRSSRRCGSSTQPQNHALLTRRPGNCTVKWQGFKSNCLQVVGFHWELGEGVGWRVDVTDMTMNCHASEIPV